MQTHAASTQNDASVSSAVSFHVVLAERDTGMASRKSLGGNLEGKINFSGDQAAAQASHWVRQPVHGGHMGLVHLVCDQTHMLRFRPCSSSVNSRPSPYVPLHMRKGGVVLGPCAAEQQHVGQRKPHNIPQQDIPQHQPAAAPAQELRQRAREQHLARPVSSYVTSSPHKPCTLLEPETTVRTCSHQ